MKASLANKILAVVEAFESVDTYLPIEKRPEDHSFTTRTLGTDLIIELVNEDGKKITMTSGEIFEQMMKAFTAEAKKVQTEALKEWGKQD